MPDVFPVPAEHEYLYGEYECAYGDVSGVDYHHVLKLNLSKPDAGTGSEDMNREEVKFDVLEVCEKCWDERFGPVQHWYEHEYLPEEMKAHA